MKKLRQNVNLKGKFHLRHWRNGNLLSEEVINNTTTTAGIAEVAGLINEVTSGGFKWIELGATSVTAAASDTALGSAITAAGMARAAATCTRSTTDGANDTARLEHTFTATATQAVREAGIFDSSSAGVMLAHQTFTAKNMEANDTLDVVWKIDVD